MVLVLGTQLIVRDFTGNNAASGPTAEVTLPGSDLTDSTTDDTPTAELPTLLNTTAAAARLQTG